MFSILLLCGCNMTAKQDYTNRFVIEGKFINQDNAYLDGKLKTVVIERVDLFSGSIEETEIEISRGKFTYELELDQDYVPTNLIFIRGFDNGDVFTWVKEGLTELNISARTPNACDGNNRKDSETLTSFYNQLKNSYFKIEKERKNALTNDDFSEDEKERLVKQFRAKDYTQYTLALTSFVIDNNTNEEAVALARDELIPILSDYFTGKYMTHFVHPDLAETTEGKRTNGILQCAKKRVGALPPDFSVTKINGDTIKMIDYLGKNRLYCFYDFDEKSEKEIKTIKRLSDKYKDRDDFVFINIYVGKDFDKWTKYVSENDLDKPNCVQCRLGKKRSFVPYSFYRNKELPVTCFIEDKGRFAVEGLTGKGMEIDLDRIFDGDLFYRKRGQSPTIIME